MSGGADDEPRAGERGEDEAGWAVPDLEAREPQTGPEPTNPTPPTPPPPPPPPGPPPGALAPVASAPAAPPPGAPAPTDAWALPPGGVGPAPRPVRKRRGWLVVLILALGLILLFAIAGTVLFVDRSLPPYQGAYDFLDDVTAGREQAAVAGLCAADRSDPQAAFGALNRRIHFGDTVSVNALSVDRDDDRATVEILVDPGGSARTRSFDLPMREEGGDWKACPGDLLQ